MSAVQTFAVFFKKNLSGQYKLLSPYVASFAALQCKFCHFLPSWTKLCLVILQKKLWLPRNLRSNNNYQIERVYVLSHVRDVCRLLGERHVELASDAVGQLNVTRRWEDTSHRCHHLVHTHLKCKNDVTFKNKQILMTNDPSSGVNFINVPRAAFAPVYPKSIKRYWLLDRILTLLGPTSIKAVCRMLIKLSPVYLIVTNFNNSVNIKDTWNEKNTTLLWNTSVDNN